jgi:Flp pilus assembly protein TadG
MNGEHMQRTLRGRKKNRLRGQTLIEFTMALPLLLLLLFGTLNVSWLIYRAASLQFAVREGCRYAVTNQVLLLQDTGGNNYGVIESVKYIVQQRAMGLLGSKPTDPGYQYIHVNYYSPSSSLTSPDTSSTQNRSGNLVEVSVVGVPGTNLIPFMPVFFPINLAARSSDRVEGAPIGGLPPAGNQGP